MDWSSLERADWRVVPANSMWVLVELDLAPGQTLPQAVARSHEEVRAACGIEPDEDGVVDADGVTDSYVLVRIIDMNTACSSTRAATSASGAAVGSGSDSCFTGVVRTVATDHAATRVCGAPRPRRLRPCKNRTLHGSGRCHYHRPHSSEVA